MTVDEALAKETNESLTEWLNERRRNIDASDNDASSPHAENSPDLTMSKSTDNKNTRNAQLAYDRMLYTGLCKDDLLSVGFEKNTSFYSYKCAYI